MDNVSDLSSMFGSGADSRDLHPDPEPGNHGLEVSDLREVRLESLIQIGEIITKFESLKVPKEQSLSFIHHLTQSRDAWFVEAGSVGLLYLTEIVPRRDAKFHILFWNGSLEKGHLAATKTILTEGFQRFELLRVNAEVPVHNLPMKRFLKDLGFVLEGVTRQGWWNDSPPADLVHYGILNEEKPWPVLAMEGA